MGSWDPLLLLAAEAGLVGLVWSKQQALCVVWLPAEGIKTKAAQQVPSHSPNHLVCLPSYPSPSFFNLFSTSLLVSGCFMKGRTKQFALGITEMWHSKPLPKWKQREGCILLLSIKMKSGACGFGPPVPFPSPCTPASTDAPHVDQGCVA